MLSSVRPALRPVGHHQMGVQQRVTLAAGAVVEPNGQQPMSGHMLDTAVATSGTHMLIQVSDRLSQPSMMCPGDRPSGGRVT
jgi:hypothetical protein